MQHPEIQLIKDKAPICKSRHMRAYFFNAGIDIFAWPASSPNMNSIKNIWQILKQKVRARLPKTEAEMRTVVQEE
jgi:DDE superfamily endonuclease